MGAHTKRKHPIPLLVYRPIPLSVTSCSKQNPICQAQKGEKRESKREQEHMTRTSINTSNFARTRPRTGLVQIGIASPVLLFATHIRQIQRRTLNPSSRPPTNFPISWKKIRSFGTNKKSVKQNKRNPNRRIAKPSPSTKPPKIKIKSQQNLIREQHANLLPNEGPRKRKRRNSKKKKKKKKKKKEP